MREPRRPQPKGEEALRVLVVDDSAFARQTITDILKGLQSIEVIGKATDGADAIPKVLKLLPDLITLDLEMPHMGGFEFLRWLMVTRPTPVIVVSSVTEATDVFRALELGAVDFIRKPRRNASLELRSIRDEIRRVIEELPHLKMTPHHGRHLLRPRRELLARPAAIAVAPPAPEPARIKPLRAGTMPPGIVVIGASTGGPSAIERVLKPLQAGYPSPILIIQHMPAGFTRLFAERLDRLTKLRVQETRTGLKLEPGHAYVSAGGMHTICDREGMLATVPSHPDDRYVPSVDRTMLAVASIWGDACLGILLTGMGDDGKQGMLQIAHARGFTVAESEETSLVFGMPERAIAAGAVDLVLPIDEIGDLLVSLGQRRGK